MTVERFEQRLLMASGPWSSPATWADGTVPVTGEVVTIPAGDVVTLDVNTPALGGIVINGTLQALDNGTNLSITSRYVGVDGGTLRVGTEADPFDARFTLTLTGADVGANITVGHHAFGDKFLGVAGGTIDIHGASRSKDAWTKLNTTTAAGATSITVADTTGWLVGDKIVIAPSGLDPYQSERRTISSISGNTITLDAPLVHPHYGLRQTIEGKVVDMRAEVGLLSRNILIQGDAGSYRAGLNDTTNYIAGFGGHVMVHHQSTVRIEGAEFYRMGQTGKQGRYNIHWHLAGDAAGSYAKSNSLHDSFMRGIVTHQTSNVLVQDNVAFRVLNHVFIPSEDGETNEVGNRYVGNLGVLAIEPLYTDFAFGDPVNPQPGVSTQDEDNVGMFWSRNANNTVRGNAAAGVTHGSGFVFRGGPFAQVEAFDFGDNTAHTIVGGEGQAPNYAPDTHGHGVLLVGFGEDFPVENTQYLDNLTVYKTLASGIWTEDEKIVIRNAVIADTPSAVIVVEHGEVRDSLIIGDSANTIGGPPRPTADIRVRGGIVGGTTHGADDRQFVLRNVTFKDLSGPAVYTADVESWQGVLTTSGIRLINTQAFLNLHNVDSAGEIGIRAIMGGYVDDQDGSLTGLGVPSRIYGQRDNPGAEWRYIPAANAFYVRNDGAAATPGVRAGDYLAYDDLDLGGVASTGDARTFISGGFGWSTNGSSYWTRTVGSARTVYAANDRDRHLSLGGSGSVVERRASMAGVTSATLAFTYNNPRFGAADSVFVEVYNGSSWQTIRTLSNVPIDSTWRSTSVAIPAGALNANFKVRFRASNTTANKSFNIDEVTITGTRSGGAALTAAPGSFTTTTTNGQAGRPRKSLAAELFADKESILA